MDERERHWRPEDNPGHEEPESNLVKNTCLRGDLRKVMGFGRVDSVMKILKNQGLISGD